jgi:hypothetical protein
MLMRLGKRTTEIQLANGLGPPCTVHERTKPNLLLGAENLVDRAIRQ